MGDHICPWWLAYTFDNPFRHFFHNPEKMLGSYVAKGMTVLDVGCGMGFFSISFMPQVKRKDSYRRTQVSCFIKALPRDCGFSSRVRSEFL